MEPSRSPRPWWRRVRLSVRALMVLVLVVGGVLGWFVRRATIQRDAVRAITAAGGRVNYDYQVWPSSFFKPNPTPPGPKWLVDLLGVDFFANATTVRFKTAQADAILEQVGRLRRLERLDARLMTVTDAGLAHLAGLTELRSVSCSGTPGLTDAGLAHLAGLERLESLSIEGSMSIKGPGLAHLARLKRLRFLCVDLKSDVGLPSLMQLTGLRRLFLGLTEVTDAGVADLSRLTWLEELSFGGELGSEARMTDLWSLKNLKLLNVYGPWFTDAGLPPVSEMDQLATFFVADTTSVTPDGLNHLQRRRPTLRLGVDGSGQVPRARTDLLRRAIGPDSIRTGLKADDGN